MFSIVRPSIDRVVERAEIVIRKMNEKFAIENMEWAIAAAVAARDTKPFSSVFIVRDDVLWCRLCCRQWPWHICL